MNIDKNFPGEQLHSETAAFKVQGGRARTHWAHPLTIPITGSSIGSAIFAWSRCHILLSTLLNSISPQILPLPRGIWTPRYVVPWAHLTQPSGISSESAIFKNNSRSISMSITDQQTCLLYTSPSPRDRQKSRMPSSA